MSDFLLSLAIVLSLIAGLITNPAGTVAVIAVLVVCWLIFEKILNH